MNKATFNNAFREEVFDLPNIPGVLTGFDNDKEDRGIRMALTTPEHFAPRAVLLMGCGDSYCAGLAAEPGIDHGLCGVSKLPCGVLRSWVHG